MEEVAAFVEGELAGPGRLQGYRWMHQRAILRGFVVSQETIRLIIKILDPEGVELRRARRYIQRSQCLMAYASTGNPAGDRVQPAPPPQKHDVYLFVCETYSEVQLHEMLHVPHFNSPPLKQQCNGFILVNLRLYSRKFTTLIR